MKVLLLLKKLYICHRQTRKIGIKNKHGKSDLWELVRVTAILKSHQAKNACSMLRRWQISVWLQGSLGRNNALKWWHSGKLSYYIQNKCTLSVSKKDIKTRCLFLNKLWQHHVFWSMSIFFGGGRVWHKNEIL